MSTRHIFIHNCNARDDFPVWEVVESKRWKNKKTGATASIYGAVPYYNDSDKVNWTIETVGWTLRNNRRNTVGTGRAPYTSKAEAEQAALKMNAGS